MNTNVGTNPKGPRGLKVIREQLDAATKARKCHSCDCFHSAVAAFERTELGRTELSHALAAARTVFVAKEYDCLGCPVCYPAIATNALADAYPEQTETLDLCPTDAPRERGGWPPLPGDFHVVRYRASVAVCTLNDAKLAAAVARAAPDALGITGTLHTENLGIERVIRNVLANPYIRFLILCGEDTQQSVGHLPGQSLVSLFDNGLDDRGRIRGARGKRPVLKNVGREQVEAFIAQVELIDMIGASDVDSVEQKVQSVAGRDPGPFQKHVEQGLITAVLATEPRRLIPDPAGYFVVYPDASRSLLTLEHYGNDGVLDAIIEGRSPAAVYTAAVEQKLLSRFDHAAYLGGELARAELSMRTGERYVQDRAPGDSIEVPETGCGCSSTGCGGTS